MVYQINLKHIFREARDVVTKNKKLINDLVRLDVLREEVEYANVKPMIQDIYTQQ